MMDVLNCPIYITLAGRNRGPNVNEPGTVRNILISNVIATGVSATSGIQITGLPETMWREYGWKYRIHYNGGGTTKAGRINPPELDKGIRSRENGVMPRTGFARHVHGLDWRHPVQL